MALTTQQQAEFLFKNALGAADTSAERSGAPKEYFNEALGSRPVVFSTSVWSQVADIPIPAPTLQNGETDSSGVVKYFVDEPFIALTGQYYDHSTNTQYAEAGPGRVQLPDSGTAFWCKNLQDAIPFNFDVAGATYAYGLKKSNGNPIVSGEKNWVLDVASGIINFYSGLPPGVTLQTPPTVSFYKYVGSKGGGGGGGASITISDVEPTGASPGAMWWNSLTGDLLIYYDDGDSQQWVSAIGGVGGLWTLNTGTNTITTAYNIAKAGGSFKIPHPLPELTESHFLYHSFVEGPRADLIYRGEVQLLNGRATINIDKESKMTDGTFEALSRNPSCFTTNETDWTPVRGKVKGNLLEIESQDPNATSTVSWLVISERKDPAACNLEWTDSEGYAHPEVLKETLKSDEKPKLDPIILRTSL